MTIKDIIKQFAKDKDMTLKEVASKSNMNYTGLMDKFRRGSITLRDLEKILDVLGKRITFTDKTQQSQTRQQQDKTPPTRK